mmetsp:Transcript_22876/g.54015  ORF Transcript_22876/g.54015 Transcript_22876/m.54015 type:complete len:507 (+) Transcript_22876:205-1725(+)
MAMENNTNRRNNSRNLAHCSLSMLVVLALFLPWSATTDAFVVPSVQTQHTKLCGTSRSFEETNSELLSCIRTDEDEPNTLSRRSALLSAAKSASAAFLALSIDPFRANADDSEATTTVTTATTTTTVTPIQAKWKAVDGLNTMEESAKNFVGFDASSYQAMINDQSRTPMFYKVMADRIDDGKGASTVLDLGTGPFAIFAIKAAELGAKKVYAIEANPKAAEMARETIRKKGFEDIITVLEGFSTDVSLPDGDKADLIVAEIIGSIASEEGVVATIADAHKRFAKNPTSDASWIPSRVQTYAAPASYTLHNLFGPPGFDWSKLDGEPVRFNCRDEGLQLLADPQMVEDIRFATIDKLSSSNRKTLDFAVDTSRTVSNTDKLVKELQANKLGKSEAIRAADATAHSFSGMAFWPRLILGSDVDGNADTINSRQFPGGGHQRSHWQTVLPIMKDRPVAVTGGDTISVAIDFEVPTGSKGTSDLQTPATYQLDGKVTSSVATRPEPALM